jgi:hypothetical protein
MRTRGLTAAIEGLLATAWFAWARADAPSSAESWLAAGGVAGLVVACAGLGVAASGYARPRPARDAGRRRRYERILAAELVPLGAGAAVLAALGQSPFIPVWLCAGLGVHLLPAARVSRTPFLAPAGLAILASAAAALAAGLATAVAPVVIAGSGAGACLLVTALGSLAGAAAAARPAARGVR